MPTLDLTDREAVLLDKALWAYIATDEDEEIQALVPVREKLARLPAVAGAQRTGVVPPTGGPDA